MREYEDLFLGIDIGTESIRCGLFDIWGNCINLSTEEIKTIIPKLGWAEQNPKQIFSKLISVINSCMRIKNVDRKKIKAIAVDGTSVSLIPINKNGEPIDNVILWMDTRAWEEANYINQKGNKVLYYVGGKDSPEWMIPKALWLKKNKPNIYNSAKYIVELSDWINYKLTRKWALSKCNLSCEWNYVSEIGGWSKKFLSEIGMKDLTEKWPNNILNMGDPIGEINIEIGNILGLNSKTLVVQSGMDTYAASLGVNVLKSGNMAMVLGSSSCYLTVSKLKKSMTGIFGPIPDAILPNMWHYQGGQTSAGSIVRWFVETIVKGNGRRKIGNSEYSKLDQIAKKVPVGSDGLIFLDTWQGERTPVMNPFSRGAMIGISLFHKESHLFRGILESVAYGAKQIIDNFERNGFKVSRLQACGGGINSDIWMQIYSDVVGKPIDVSNNPNASALGSAICAAKGYGIYNNLEEASKNMTKTRKTFSPDFEKNKNYKYYYNKYLLLKNELRPYFNSLAKHKLR